MDTHTQMHDVNTTVQVLIHLLAHKDEIVRQRAAAALGPLIFAPNALGALQSLCDLLRVEWNEDVRRAALCSITQLSELDVMRVVDSLVAACKQDSSGAAEEGLIAVAELLNLKARLGRQRMNVGAHILDAVFFVSDKTLPAAG